MYGSKTFIKKKFSASSFWKDCYKYQITVRNTTTDASTELFTLYIARCRLQSLQSLRQSLLTNEIAPDKNIIE
jgi:hypothetical protein